MENGFGLKIIVKDFFKIDFLNIKIKSIFDETNIFWIIF